MGVSISIAPTVIQDMRVDMSSSKQFFMLINILWLFLMVISMCLGAAVMIEAYGSADGLIGKLFEMSIPFIIFNIFYLAIYGLLAMLNEERET